MSHIQSVIDIFKFLHRKKFYDKNQTVDIKVVQYIRPEVIFKDNS
jgi:hypothetical protein